jgi:hypothetical protein
MTGKHIQLGCEASNQYPDISVMRIYLTTRSADEPMPRWQTASVADEWFKSPAWGPDDQEEFERRLARARAAGRWQYLRIRGWLSRRLDTLTARDHCGYAFCIRRDTS